MVRIPARPRFLKVAAAVVADAAARLVVPVEERGAAALAQAVADRRMRQEQSKVPLKRVLEVHRGVLGDEGLMLPVVAAVARGAASEDEILFLYRWVA